jgi:hypothetical protein
MFLQDFTPDTTRYMVLGFSVSFVVMTLYVFSLYIRARNLQRDLTLLDELEKTDSK